MEKAIKKIIVLAHDFPPLNSIGAKRPGSWFKHFRTFGIYPVIVTLDWQNENNANQFSSKIDQNDKVRIQELKEGTIIKVPFKPKVIDWIKLKYGMKRMVLFRRIISYLSLYLRFISTSFDPTYRIYKEAKLYMYRNNCDAIIATGEPFVLFKHAAELSSEFSIPWIADYRDGWTTNQGGVPLSFAENLLNIFYKHMETKYLKTVKLITTAAPSYAQSLSLIHPSKKIKVIYNGFEEEVLEEFKDVEQKSSVFEIAYAGTLYPYQQLEVFLEGYKEFTKQHQPNTRLTFYGLSFYPDMMYRVEKFDESLKPFIQFTERLPYNKLMKQLRQSHIMLLLSNEGTNWLNAKFFDYLAVNRKIVLVKNDFGILERMLKDTQGGVALSDSKSVFQFLVEHYTSFIQTGKLDHETKVDYFYTRGHQAEIMSDTILTMLNCTKPGLQVKSKIQN